MKNYRPRKKKKLKSVSLIWWLIFRKRWRRERTEDMFGGRRSIMWNSLQNPFCSCSNMIFMINKPWMRWWSKALRGIMSLWKRSKMLRKRWKLIRQSRRISSIIPRPGKHISLTENQVTVRNFLKHIGMKLLFTELPRKPFPNFRKVRFPRWRSWMMNLQDCFLRKKQLTMSTKK